MKRYLLLGSLCIAFALGLWHLDLAMQAIFLFRNNEPLTSWAAILFGPGSTLIAATMAIFTKKGGAYWLIAGGLLSFIAFLIGERSVTDNVFPFLWKISAPMLLLGASIAFLSSKRSPS